MNAILVLYSFFGDNLGWAIIVLTIILKLVLYPFTKSQLASSQKIKDIQPQLKKLQKKYKRNPKKLQEEQLKLYKRVGYNPLGCFFSVLLPLPILIAIYQAVSTFTGGEVTGIYQFVKDLLDANGDIKINTIFYFMDLSKAYLPVAQEVGYLKLETLPYLLLVVLTGVSQYISVKVTSAQTQVKEEQKLSKGGKAPEEDMAASMSKSMSYTFPLLTTFVALSMPSGVALYWVVQSFITVITQLVYNKISRKEK
ncbi:MAG: YidC/Oxa1 family membrane protein insertase [bacterium]